MFTKVVGRQCNAMSAWWLVGLLGAVSFYSLMRRSVYAEMNSTDQDEALFLHVLLFDGATGWLAFYWRPLTGPNALGLMLTPLSE